MAKLWYSDIDVRTGHGPALSIKGKQFCFFREPASCGHPATISRVIQTRVFSRSAYRSDKVLAALYRSGEYAKRQPKLLAVCESGLKEKAIR